MGNLKASLGYMSTIYALSDAMATSLKDTLDNCVAYQLQVQAKCPSPVRDAILEDDVLGKGGNAVCISGPLGSGVLKVTDLPGPSSVRAAASEALSAYNVHMLLGNHPVLRPPPCTCYASTTSAASSTRTAGGCRCACPLIVVPHRMYATAVPTSPPMPRWRGSKGLGPALCNGGSVLSPASTTSPGSPHVSCLAAAWSVCTRPERWRSAPGDGPGGMRAVVVQEMPTAHGRPLWRVLTELERLRNQEQGPHLHDFACMMLAQMVLLLHELHEHGAIHGDLSPANIMVRGAFVQLLDFGHASLLPHAPMAWDRCWDEGRWRAFAQPLPPPSPVLAAAASARAQLATAKQSCQQPGTPGPGTPLRPGSPSFDSGDAYAHLVLTLGADSTDRGGGTLPSAPTVASPLCTACKGIGCNNCFSVFDMTSGATAAGAVAGRLVMGLVRADTGSQEITVPLLEGGGNSSSFGNSSSRMETADGWLSDASDQPGSARAATAIAAAASPATPRVAAGAVGNSGGGADKADPLVPPQGSWKDLSQRAASWRATSQRSASRRVAEAVAAGCAPLQPRGNSGGMDPAWCYLVSGGAAWYAAPEVASTWLPGQPFLASHEAMDWWSLGVLLAEVLVGRGVHPLVGDDPDALALLSSSNHEAAMELVTRTAVHELKSGGLHARPPPRAAAQKQPQGAGVGGAAGGAGSGLSSPGSPAYKRVRGEEGGEADGGAMWRHRAGRQVHAWDAGAGLGPGGLRAVEAVDARAMGSLGSVVGEEAACAWRELVGGLLQVDPCCRWGIDELVESELFARGVQLLHRDAAHCSALLAQQQAQAQAQRSTRAASHDKPQHSRFHPQASQQQAEAKQHADHRASTYAVDQFAYHLGCNEHAAAMSSGGGACGVRAAPPAAAGPMTPRASVAEPPGGSVCNSPLRTGKCGCRRQEGVSQVEGALARSWVALLQAHLDRDVMPLSVKHTLGSSSSAATATAAREPHAYQPVGSGAPATTNTATAGAGTAACRGCTKPEVNQGGKKGHGLIATAHGGQHYLPVGHAAGGEDAPLVGPGPRTCAACGQGHGTAACGHGKPAPRGWLAPLVDMWHWAWTPGTIHADEQM